MGAPGQVNFKVVVGQGDYPTAMSENDSDPLALQTAILTAGLAASSTKRSGTVHLQLSVFSLGVYPIQQMHKITYL